MLVQEEYWEFYVVEQQFYLLFNRDFEQGSWKSILKSKRNCH